jgi:hypothetical protein
MAAQRRWNDLSPPTRKLIIVVASCEERPHGGGSSTSGVGQQARSGAKVAVDPSSRCGQFRWTRVDHILRLRAAPPSVTTRLTCPAAGEPGHEDHVRRRIAVPWRQGSAQRSRRPLAGH